MMRIIFFASVMHFAHYNYDSKHNRFQPSDLSCKMYLHQECPIYGMCIGVGVQYNVKMTISSDEKSLFVDGIHGYIGPTLLDYGKDWHRIAWDVPILRFKGIFIRAHGRNKSGHLFDDQNNRIDFDCSTDVAP